MSIAIAEGTVPQDETPSFVDEAPATDATEATGWFNPEYPHSTEEHPYGYFPISASNPDPDFSRPRKRRPHNRSGSGSSVATSARADTTAKTAAAMLSRMNSFVGMALMSFGMPLSGQALNEANSVFEDMAYEALQTDPTLARKILSAGATSGKAQLTMAYVMLGGSIAPVAYMEVKSKRENEDV
ncbi:MAG TPA: hypothetical protein VIY48_22125 [Candidatus Paceibacterota bacterium]